jgi:hypothetical protein
MSELSKEDFKKIDRFNSAIKSLCTIVTKLDPNNFTLERIKKQIDLFIYSNPVEIRNVAKPYLLKYQTHIKEKNEDFFLKSEFEEFSNASNEIIEIFGVITTKWPSLNAGEKKLIWEKIYSMLDNV